MAKKLYFLNVNSLYDGETYASLSNEEFAKRAEIVYDSIVKCAHLTMFIIAEQFNQFGINFAITLNRIFN